MFCLIRSAVLEIRVSVHTQNNNCGGTVADFFVLGTRELQHALSSRVADFDLTQDRVSVIRQNDGAYRYFMSQCKFSVILKGFLCNKSHQKDFYGGQSSHLWNLPEADKIILSIDLGPKAVLIISATVYIQIEVSFANETWDAIAKHFLLAPYALKV